MGELIPLEPRRGLRTMVGLVMSTSKRHNVVPIAPRAPVALPPPADPSLLLVAALQQQIATLQQQLVALEARLRALETERRAPMPAASAPTAGPPASFSEHRERERLEIVAGLEATGWNRIETAKRLGIPRRTLYRRMEEYGIQQGDSRKKKAPEG